MPITTSIVNTSAPSDVPHNMEQEQSGIIAEVKQVQPSTINITGNARVHLGDNQRAAQDPYLQRRVAIAGLLLYEGYGTKRQQLSTVDALPESFKWLEATNFSAWLGSDTKHIFWIKGKPGSGKSTVMKYLADSPNTIDSLNHAGGKDWEIVHFFYDYRAGHTIANTPLGMLKTFMLQLSTRYKQISMFLEEQHLELEKDNLHSYIDIFCAVVNRFQRRICAFIDGLDEYEGNLFDLSSVIAVLQQRTKLKLCIASRPETAFDSFPSLAGGNIITMQDHNDAAIRFCIRHKVQRFEIAYYLLQARFTVGLQEELVKMAQGIILWATLVVDEILGSLLDDPQTSSEDLQALVRTLPSDLEQLYARILEKSNKQYQVEAALLLYLLIEHEATFDETPCTTTVLYQAFDYLNFTLLGKSPGPVLDYADYDFRVKGLLGQLVDVIGGTHDCGIRLIHKSLSVYLIRSDWIEAHVSPVIANALPNFIWKRLAVELIQIEKSTHASDAVWFDRFSHAVKVKAGLSGLGDTNAYLQEVRRCNVSPRWSHLFYYCVDSFYNFDQGFVARTRTQLRNLSFPLAANGPALLHLFGCTICLPQGPKTPLLSARLWALYKHNKLALYLDLAHSRPWDINLDIAVSSGNISEDLLSSLYDAVLMRIAWHIPRGHGPYTELLHAFRRHGFHLDRRHLCMHSLVGCLIRKQLIPYITTVAPQSRCAETHDPACPSEGQDFYQHWLYLPTNADGSWQAILDTMGLDLPAAFSTAGGVYNAILESLNANAAGSVRNAYQKVLIAVHLGIAPCPKVTRKDPQAYAKSLRRKVRMKAFLGSSGSQELYKQFLDDMILALEHYSHFGVWRVGGMEEYAAENPVAL